MDIFDSVADTFGAVFGSVYPEGTFHRATRTEAADGGASVTFADTTISVQTDACTYAMRQAEGYTSRDARLLVLRRTPAGDLLDEPTPEDQITAGGRRWALFNIETDAAGSHWSMRGSPA